MARSIIAEFRSPQDPLGGTTVVWDSIPTVTAASLLVVGWSFEGGFGDPMATITDTINGSPSGKTWFLYSFGATREAGVAYCFDHPGGSNVVITGTVANGGSRSYREGYGVVLSGQAAEPNPRTLAQQTYTDPTTGTSTFTFNMPGDGTLFASVTSVASLPGFTPTSPAELVSTLSTPANYGGCMLQFTTGSGNRTIASTGGQATYLMNGIALAFNDPVTGTAPSITDQPDPTTVTEGSTATFNVSATGTGTLTYQWRKDGSNISGANSSSYTTPPTVLADNGALFDVIVTGDTAPPATSNTALLTVNPVSAATAIITVFLF